MTLLIQKDMVIHHNFDDFDVMQIEFTGTANSSITHCGQSLLSFGMTDFTMTKGDMTSSPQSNRYETVMKSLFHVLAIRPGTGGKPL